MFAQSQARIYKLSCLPTLTPNKESSIIIVGWKTDLQRLHSFHFISINWKYFYFSAEIILLCIISNMLCLDVTPSFCNNHNRKYDPSKQRYPMNIINKREKWFFILSSNLSKLSQKKERYEIFRTNKTIFPKNSP